MWGQHLGLGRWVAGVLLLYFYAFCLVQGSTPGCGLPTGGGSMSRRGISIVPPKNTLLCPPLGCLLCRSPALLPQGLHMYSGGVLSGGKQNGGCPGEDTPSRDISVPNWR